MRAFRCQSLSGQHRLEWFGATHLDHVDTRAIIDAILDGAIDQAETKQLPIFNLTIPLELPNVDPHILDPRDTYTSDADWQVKALDLAARFIKNFAQYADNEEGKKLVAAGPQLP